MNKKSFLFPVAAFAALFVSTVTSRADVVIQAYVDGPSALHVRPDGISWENGENAKPGRHDFRNDPTYVNGRPWIPEWTKPTEGRGQDNSDWYPVKTGGPDLELELVSVSETRQGTDLEERSPITLRKQDGELLVVIPDDQWGARWYKFILRPSSVPAAPAKP